jgi:membrane-bound lytic murein transglycosylase D
MLPDGERVQSPWVRLRQRLAMPGCDYNPAVRRWAHTYTQSPTQFTASMSEAMPYLLVVLDEIERRDLPGEFAFLPYIESTYTPVSSRGDHAAGIWQLMPDTARETGLPITPDYDGRLDIYASTQTALDLLERYQREFEDWRVVDLAYNAGEYGVKSLVGSSTFGRDADDLARLRVSPGAHDHLAKLLAVACVASDPERFHVELPEPTADDLLTHIAFSAPVDLDLVAWIAGVDVTQLRRYNPGYTSGRMPANGPYGLLIPAAQKEAVETALSLVPATLWQDWHEISLQQDEAVAVIAAAHDLDADAVAAINHVTPDGVLPAGRRVLLPGRGDGPAKTEAHRESVTARATAAPAVHVVRSGETLWNIARNEHVRLDDLLRWNKLQRTATLHRGQRLRLAIPGAETTALTISAGAQ